MITIRLPGDIEAHVEDGEWTVEGNEELTRVLNSTALQPPAYGPYAPSADARMAEHVLRVMGGDWVSSDEPPAPEGKLY